MKMKNQYKKQLMPLNWAKAKKVSQPAAGRHQELVTLRLPRQELQRWLKPEKWLWWVKGKWEEHDQSYDEHRHWGWHLKSVQ